MGGSVSCLGTPWLVSDVGGAWSSLLGDVFSPTSSCLLIRRIQNLVVGRKPTSPTTSQLLLLNISHLEETGQILSTQLYAWLLINGKVNQWFSQINEGVVTVIEAFSSVFFLCSAPLLGAPVVASFPHFYLAEDKYVKAVGGMSPQREHHQTFLDLNPVTYLSAVYFIYLEETFTFLSH